MNTAFYVSNLLKQLDLDKCIENSFKNYHTAGFNYINLFRSPELTIKLYLFYPSQVKTTARGYLVNPHTHAYSFTTDVLFGSVKHLIFEEHEEGYAWDKYKYEYQKSPEERLTLEGEAKMLIKSALIHRAGETYSVDTNAIHSLVLGQEVTGLLLHQFQNTVSGGTMFYSREKETEFTSDTYQKYTKEEIRHLLFEEVVPRLGVSR